VEAILNHDAIIAYREMRSHLMSARSAATRPVSDRLAVIGGSK